MNVRFSDREEAGRMLADLLGAYARERPIVLALPRGGVPVGNEVAKALNAPLDIWVVRKIGAPEFPELGVGAVAEGGLVHLDPEVLAEVGLTEEEARRLARDKQFEVEERVHRLRGDKPPPDVSGRTVILVDDGIATGGTMRASIAALRRRNPAKIVMAVPVAAAQTLSAMRDLVDDVVCIEAPTAMHAIGQWYEDFTQTSDEEVSQILDRANHRLRRAQAKAASSRATASPVVESHEVKITTEGGDLHGSLAVPEHATGIVLFAHGSGSSRFSPRNQHVAAVLRHYGLGTFLFDLLTEEEEVIDDQTAEYRFDIRMLAERLVEVTDWLWTKQNEPAPSGMQAEESPFPHGLTEPVPIGYFGSSTGAAAALVAAAQIPQRIAAVVSRGGRPDLAWSSLERVRAPTLLIVGGNDRAVLELNQRAAGRLIQATHEISVIPRATHLFEEAGALDIVAELAGHWFQRFFGIVRAELAHEHP